VRTAANGLGSVWGPMEGVTGEGGVGLRVGSGSVWGWAPCGRDAPQSSNSSNAPLNPPRSSSVMSNASATLKDVSAHEDELASWSL